MAELLIVDRIEEGIAVCQDEARERIELPIELLPAGTREGDCLRREGSGWAPAPEETERRRLRSAGLLERLLKKRPEE